MQTITWTLILHQTPAMARVTCTSCHSPGMYSGDAGLLSFRCRPTGEYVKGLWFCAVCPHGGDQLQVHQTQRQYSRPTRCDGCHMTIPPNVTHLHIDVRIGDRDSLAGIKTAWNGDFCRRCTDGVCMPTMEGAHA